MIGKNKQVVSVIQTLITSKKTEKGIVNEVTRDDVYAFCFYQYRKSRTRTDLNSGA